MFNLPTFLIVAKREYLKVVRSKSFWISTFMFPIFILLVSFVSGYSAEQTEKKIIEEAQNVDSILLFDPQNIINPSLLNETYSRIDNLEEGIDAVRNDNTDALFVYPKGIVESRKISVYAPDTGLLSRNRFDSFARELLNQSLLLEIKDPAKLSLAQTQVTVDTTIYAEGEKVVFSIEDVIVPIVTILLYFMMTFLASNFLLASVSEEKETRMIEIVLSILRSKDLISGKIIGLVGVVVTQITVLGGFIIALLPYSLKQLPIEVDVSSISLPPEQILLSLFYLITGFLFISAIMVGVGAAMPNYKDAQSFASVFIMLSIFPIYFASLILQDPSGLLAQILSYTPFTAPLVLLARNVMGALPPIEAVISSVVLILYVYVGFWLAFRLFEIGSLEYTNKLSLKRVWQKLTS